jgi:hypothetical protein
LAYAGSAARGRRWADIAAILASVVLLGYSVWGGMLAGDSEALSEVRNIGLARMSNAFAGLLGVLGIFAAQRSRGMGKAMVIAGGAVALVGLFAFNTLDATALAAAGAPGAVLLVSGFFVGPMPHELEERD